MAVNVKMDVDIGSFTSGIKQGQQILKGLNAEMKASESEFKATGNAEQKLASQTKTLTSQLNVQKGIADQAKQALKAMTDAGVEPTDAAYQKLYATMMNATAGMNDAQAALNALKGGSENAKQGADDLTESLEGIGKKISLEQVRSGITSITTGLENAAKKAIQLGESIWNAVMDKAAWADDTATMAQMYGIDLDTFLRMQALVETGLDTSVDAILKSQKKLRKGIGEENKKTMEALFELNLAFETTKGGMTQLISDDEIQLFWMAGQALMNMSDAYDKEAAAQAMFGRSWEELVPLFTKYKSFEEYQKALEGVQVASEDDVNALAELNDKVAELKQKLDVLSTDILATLAPALTDAATALSGLLDEVLAYLKTPDGQKALADLSTAVSGLFEDLGKIDPQDVVSGFTEVFNTVVGSVQWLTEHWNEVVTAMESIVGGWALLKVTGGILDVVMIVSGLKTMTGATAAGEAAGTAWGSGFASAVLKAAPWLLFLYETLHPSAGSDALGGNTLLDENGNLTEEAKAYGYTEEYAEETKQIQDRYDAVRKLTGLTDQQRNSLQGFWSVWKDIADMQDQGLDIPQHRLDAYNLYGQQLQTLFEGQETQLSMYMEKMKELYSSGERGNTLDLTFFNIDKDGAQVMVTLKAPDDAAQQLEEQIGTAEINCVVHFVDENGNNIGVDFGDEKGEYIGGHGRRKKANGIWSVPTDNYLAYLHKGERVVPARDVQSRSYNSNLYVESMIMNNGTDAAGLAAAMAAAQQRQMSGYGS